MSSYLKKCKYCNIEKEISNFGVAGKYKDKIYTRHKCNFCINAGFKIANKKRNIRAAKYCIVCNVAVSFKCKTNRCRKCINAGNTSKKWVNSYGYILIYKNKKRVLEHRAIMEDYLGRALLDHETVHHKNGDRSDNNINNLELWSTKQPRGQKIEDKILFAKEILALYDPTSLNVS